MVSNRAHFTWALAFMVVVLFWQLESQSHNRDIAINEHWQGVRYDQDLKFAIARMDEIRTCKAELQSMQD